MKLSRTWQPPTDSYRHGPEPDDPLSPFHYLQAHSLKADSFEKIIVTPETFAEYTGLAESSLREGKPDFALNVYRQCFNSLMEIHGPDSSQYESFFVGTVKALCNHAMKNLSRNNMYSCFNVLFECHELTMPSGGSLTFRYFPQLHAMVLNNLGCAYRRINRNKKAYQYLKEAIAIVFKHKVEALIGLTYVNLCSVASQMGYHTKALYFAKNSLIYTQNDLLNLTSTRNYDPVLYKEKVHLVAVSYFNMAVEEEFHREFDKALDWYKKAYLFLEEKLGPDEPSIQKFKLAYEKTKEKLIDKALNQESSQLPRFPVGQTLKKFYRPQLKINPQENSPFQTSNIYQKITSKKPFNGQRLLSSPQAQNPIYFNRKASRPESTKISHNNFEQRTTQTGTGMSGMMLAFSEMEDNVGPQNQDLLSVKINNFLDTRNERFHQTEFKERFSTKTMPNERFDEDEPKRGGNHFDLIEKAVRQAEDPKGQNDIALLEKSGVLNWDGSESESDSWIDNDKGLANTISQKRAAFLDRLNNYENERETTQNFYPAANEKDRPKPTEPKREEQLKTPQMKTKRKGELDLETDESREIPKTSSEIRGKESEKKPILDLIGAVKKAKEVKDSEFIVVNLEKSVVETEKEYERQVSVPRKESPERKPSEKSDNEAYTPDETPERSALHEEEKSFLSKEKSHEKSSEEEKPKRKEPQKEEPESEKIKAHGLFLNHSMEVRGKAVKRKKNLALSLTNRPNKSFSSISEPNQEYDPEPTPRFTKVVIKIKDTEVQTEEDPVIKAEHLLDVSSLTHAAPIAEVQPQEPDSFTEIVLTRGELRKIKRLQNYIKERVRQRKLQEYHLKKLKREKAVIIQRAFRCMAQRNQFQLMLDNSRSDKILLRRKILKLEATERSFSDHNYYFMRVYLRKSLKTLNWVLLELFFRRIFEAFSSVSSAIDHDERVDCPENLSRIGALINRTIPMISLKDGFLEFLEPPKKDTDDSDLLEEEVALKRIQKSNPQAIKIDRKTLGKRLKILHRKVLQVRDMEFAVEKMSKRHRVLEVFHRKLNASTYLRICYCVLDGKKPRRYLTGAIIGDTSSKLNVLFLENSLLRFYNNRVTYHNLFDIIAVDLAKKTIALTEEAQFKSELEEKLQTLKTLSHSSLDKQKIIKIQAYIKGTQSRRLYEIRKMGSKLKKAGLLLGRRFVKRDREEEKCLLTLYYIKHDNILLFRLMELHARDSKPLELKKKLYEIFPLNEVKDFAQQMVSRASVAVTDQKTLKLTVPPLDKLISEKRYETQEGRSFEKDPLLETKIRFHKEFIKTCLENDHKLQRFVEPRENEPPEIDNTEEIDYLRKIQHFFRVKLLQRRIENLMLKRVRRGDISNYQKYFHTKDIPLFEESPLRMRRKSRVIQEEKKKFKRTTKAPLDPYKKETIMIRKQNFIFDDVEPAKIRVFYHIYCHTIVIEIKYRNFKKTQQLTNPLSMFELKEFNKAYFVKNFDEIILQRLRYSAAEKAAYYVKPESKPEKPKLAVIKPGTSPSKSVDKLLMNPAERRELDQKLRRGDKPLVFLERIQQKIDQDYYSMQLFLSPEHNVLRFTARSFDDPFVKIEKNLFLPEQASEFLDEHKENVMRVKEVFSHYLNKIRNKIDWEEKSLHSEKAKKEFLNVLRIELAVMKIQNAFRRLKQRRQMDLMKIATNKTKVLLLRKFYKINGKYAEVFVFLFQHKPVMEVKASNISFPLRNFKVYQADITSFLENLNSEVRTKEKLIMLVQEIIKSLSFKIINGAVFVLSSNPELKIEETEAYVETEREHSRRLKEPKSSIDAFGFLNKNFGRLNKPDGINKSEENVEENAARLIQNQYRILKLKKNREYNRMVLNAKTIYLMTIIEKVQGNYILGYFYYLKPFDEIMINLANLNQTREILKTYTIDIASVSNELYNLLQNAKKSIEKQRPSYYQKVFVNLLKLLWKRIEITFVYEKLVANSLDKGLKLKDVTELKKKKKDLEEQESRNKENYRLKQAIKIQRKFRRNKTKYIFTLVKECERKRAEELKKYGMKIKKKVKIFNEIPYYIIVYLKMDQTLTFLAMKKDRFALKITRNYHLDNLKLINTNGMDVIDFLVSNLKIYDEQIVFDIENLVPLKPSSETEQSPMLSPEALISGKLKKNFLNMLKIESLEQAAEDKPIGSPSTKMEEFFKPVVEVSAGSNAKIIHQKREDISDSHLCVFNVYYQKTKSKKKKEETEASTSDSHVQIEIDIKDIKKFNPMLDFSDKSSLKNFAEQLTQCIRVNELGEVLIDSNKINPKCLNLLHKPGQLAANPKADPIKQLKKFDKRRLLAKGVKFVGSRKYFLVADYIERPIQSLKGQVDREDNEVFEDYESLIEVIASSINNEGTKIHWEMAEQDAFVLAGSTNVKETAKILIDKLQIIGNRGEKFLYAISDAVAKSLAQTSLKMDYQSVVFLKEKALKILQNNVRSRKFLQNYKKYRQEIEEIRKNVLVKGAFKLEKERFLMILVEKGPILEVLMWDLKLFHRSKLDLKYEFYASFMEKQRNRKEVMLIIQNFISIAGKVINFEEKNCLETLKKRELLNGGKEKG